MFVKEITYENYNGEKKTEKFYFNLSKAELIELEMSYEEGFGKHLETIVERGRRPEIFEAFKQIITKAYGVKSLDGKRFIKSKEVLDDFLQSEAYSVMLSELFLAGNEAAMIEMFNAIVPKDLANVRKIEANA